MSLREKYEVWRGGEVEIVKKVWKKFRDIVMHGASVPMMYVA